MKSLSRLFLLSSLAVASAYAAEPLASDSSWRISVGPQWRELGGLDWHTGSVAASRPLPWLAGHGAGNSTTGAIPPGQGDHNYDDGFVREDSSGGAFGDTWNWGYNNASQVQGTNLVFHSANGGGSQTTTSFGTSSSMSHPAWSEELSGAGWFTEIESPAVLKQGPLSLSFKVGYSFAQADTGHSSSAVFGAVQQTRSNTQATPIQDTYDASGIIIPLAPYAGSFLGPGPLISDTPSSRSFGSATSTSSVNAAFFRSNVSESLRMNLHTISLGPNFALRCGSRVRLGLGLGFALNVADWEAHYDETLYGNSRALNHYHRDASQTNVLPGFYLEPSVEVDLTRHIGVYVSGRYDWAHSLHSDVGPSTFNFSPGGWSVLSGVRVMF